jgi:thiamine pyrophosphate-dependent acetolactate synthase large subunit-like protein
MQTSAVKGADLMVRALENEGGERIFGVPGAKRIWISSKRSALPASSPW